jgi:hypothetical protein
LYWYWLIEYLDVLDGDQKIAARVVEAREPLPARPSFRISRVPIPNLTKAGADRLTAGLNRTPPQELDGVRRLY